MPIRVEFYGIPRVRAGVAAVEVEAATLGEAVSAVSTRFPALADVCDPAGMLRPGYLANVNGNRFTSDPRTPLRDGEVVLILAADVGG